LRDAADRTYTGHIPSRSSNSAATHCRRCFGTHTASHPHSSSQSDDAHDKLGLSSDGRRASIHGQMDRFPCHDPAAHRSRQDQGRGHPARRRDDVALSAKHKRSTCRQAAQEQHLCLDIHTSHSPDTMAAEVHRASPSGGHGLYQHATGRGGEHRDRQIRIAIAVAIIRG